jgi:hypothetical protein
MFSQIGACGKCLGFLTLRLGFLTLRLGFLTFSVAKALKRIKLNLYKKKKKERKTICSVDNLAQKRKM